MSHTLPVYLFTDYGLHGPYVGLLRAAIRRTGCRSEIIDLQHDAPAFRPYSAGVLLAAQLAYLPRESVVLAVVDPGVGGERDGLVLHLSGICLVGPDNGLFAPLLDRADSVARIDWLPPDISASFHGRDWFAPVAAAEATGQPLRQTEVSPRDCVGYGAGKEIQRIIYCDKFGNAMTGIHAAGLGAARLLRVGPHQLNRARTFGRVPEGEAFWYCNSLGLVEVAINQGNAMERLKLKVGDPVVVLA